MAFQQEQVVASPVPMGLGRVVQLAKLLTGADGAAIALPGEQGVIVCQASTGAAPCEGSRLEASSGLTAECFRTAQVVRSDDMHNDARVNPSFAQRLALRSVLILPIRVDGVTVGILEVLSYRPSAFHSGHLRILRKLAGFASSERDFSAEITHGQRSALKPVSKEPVEAATVTDTAKTTTVSAKDSLLAQSLDSTTATEQEIASRGTAIPIEASATLRPQKNKVRFKTLQLRLSGHHIVVALSLLICFLLCIGLLAWQAFGRVREATPAPSPVSKAPMAKSQATFTLPPKTFSTAPASTNDRGTASPRLLVPTTVSHPPADTLKPASSELKKVAPAATSNAPLAVVTPPALLDSAPLSTTQLQPPVIVKAETHLQMPAESAVPRTELAQPTAPTTSFPQLASRNDLPNPRQSSTIEEEEETTPHQAAKSKGPGIVRDITVSRQKDSIEVHIEGTRPVRASATTLSNPERILIELDDMRVQRPRRIPVNAVDVEAVSASLYLVNPVVTRVVVELARRHTYHLFGSGNSLTLHIDGEALTTAVHAAQ